MPIYEYECLSCKHRFDEIQKFSDPAIETCPKCTHQVRKIIFAAAVHFKGSGFYATEYGKSKSTSSSEKSETKAETKSETKSEGGCGKADGSCATSAPKDATKAKAAVG
jgi:putative FmdB family regulatory protein